MMMKSIFSFFFHFTSLSPKSKSISLFLSHIRRKWCWPIILQDFKSNIPLEQSDEIVNFFVFLYVDTRNSEFIEKYWGGCCQNGCGHPGHNVNG